ncbi:MAG: cyclic nucleotide-binding domain-containing protein [Gammaproteobacteria bacterium]|nr:cyclic nucleotide-binding domain-containing protein [Gammaproteobacteria bacterium]
MSRLLDVLRDDRLVEAGVARLRDFEPSETIISEGDEGRSVYLIESGQVRVSERVELEDRRHIQPGLCDLGPNEVFGELNLFQAAPRSATVVAIDSCRLRVLDAEGLVGFLDRHPDLGYIVLRDLFAVLSSRLRQADRRLGSLLAWGLKAHGIDRHL